MDNNNASKLDEILKTDVKNEQTAIGYMLQDETASIEASRMLQPEYFFTPHAAFIFKVIKSCVDNGKSSSDILFQVQSILQEDWEQISSETVIDKASYQSPKLHADGIENVFVNGKLVWQNDTSTEDRPGMFLKGKKFN